MGGCHVVGVPGRSVVVAVFWVVLWVGGFSLPVSHIIITPPNHQRTRLKNTKFLVLDEADEMLFDCRNPEVDTERGAGKESSSNYVMLQVRAQRYRYYSGRIDGSI